MIRGLRVPARPLLHVDAPISPLPTRFSMRPIDTAPFKIDSFGEKWLSKRLLGLRREWGFVYWVGQMDAGIWLLTTDDVDCQECDAPTHWCPLPDEPEA